MGNELVTQSFDKALVKEIAMDIGKEVTSHIRVMYPDAASVFGGSGLLSVRNCVHNEIMAALKTIDADEIKKRIEMRKKMRRERHKIFGR